MLNFIYLKEIKSKIYRGKFYGIYSMIIKIHTRTERYEHLDTKCNNSSGFFFVWTHSYYVYYKLKSKWFLNVFQHVECNVDSETLSESSIEEFRVIVIISNSFLTHCRWKNRVIFTFVLLLEIGGRSCNYNYLFNARFYVTYWILLSQWLPQVYFSVSIYVTRNLTYAYPVYTKCCTTLPHNY